MNSYSSNLNSHFDKFKFFYMKLPLNPHLRGWMAMASEQSFKYKTFYISISGGYIQSWLKKKRKWGENI